jgi:hypothetical protein
VSEYLPPFGSATGGRRTATATAAITGGRLVTVLGAPAAADSVTWEGVASKDAALGDEYGVYSAPYHTLVASAAIAAGARVKCAAAGKVVTFVDGTDVHTRLVGVAVTAAAADGDEILVRMAR